MRISTIKTGDCSQCGEENTYVVKVGKLLYCLRCNRINKAKKYAENKLKRNIKKIQVEQSSSLTSEELLYRERLEQYYQRAAKCLELKPRCDNCGAFIHKKFYRAATAHILPKAIFKSVAHLDINRLFLGAGCGCHNKSEVLDNFEKLKVFPIALERVRQLLPLVNENHKTKNWWIEKTNEYANKTH